MCRASATTGCANLASDRLRKGTPMALQDRCRGLMIGLAAGNLLGILCEGWRREEIRLGWPDGVRDIEAEAGYPDDDDLARRLWVWGEENGLGMGHATNMTLTRYGGSRPRRYGSRNLSARRRGSALLGFQGCGG